MYKEKPWLSRSEQQARDNQVIQEGTEDYEDQKAESLELNPNSLPPLPEGLFDTAEISDSPELEEAVYYAYARAISRRGRAPLEEGRFHHHFFEGGNLDRSLAFGDDKRGFLLGNIHPDLGIFTPTHFAPFTMRGGYELFQELGESAEIPAILAITPDLEATLEKMPSWHSLELPDSLSAGFHTGETMEKRLMYNDYFTMPHGQALAMQAVAHYMESSQSFEKESGEGERVETGVTTIN